MNKSYKFFKLKNKRFKKFWIMKNKSVKMYKKFSGNQNSIFILI